MKIQSLPHVECAVLHDRFQPVDGESLFEFVRIAAREAGFSGECNLMITSTEKDIHVLVGDYRIMVSQNDKPLEPEGFQAALGFANTQLAFPDAAEVVGAHRANTFVTVAKGVFDPGMFGGSNTLGQTGEFVAKLFGMTDAAEAEAAMNLCARVCEHVHQHHRATAFHWCVNNQLVSPSAFERIMAGGSLLPLFIRFHLTSSAGQLTPGVPIGTFGAGTQFLIGRIVRFEEERVPFAWMAERLLMFVESCRMRGEVLPDGDTFGADDTEVIRIEYREPSESFDLPQVVLTVTRCDAHGIDHGPPPQMRIHYDERGRVQRIDTSEVEEALFREAADDGDAVRYVPKDREAYETPGMSVTQLRENARKQALNEHAAANVTRKPKAVFGRGPSNLRR